METLDPLRFGARSLSDPSVLKDQICQGPPASCLIVRRWTKRMEPLLSEFKISSGIKSLRLTVLSKKVLDTEICCILSTCQLKIRYCFV